MTTIRDILDCFETFAPAETAMAFDNVGLLVGDGNAAISRALLALDITAPVVREAAQKHCGLIISHHPVIFQPLKHLSAQSVPYLLAQHGIAAVCMHTNLDLSDIFGVNTCLAGALGVSDLRKSDKGECLFIGTLSAPVAMRDFATHAKAALDCRGVRFTCVKPTVQTVAVSSGSGGSEIFAAAAEHADVLVTGEIKHHELLASRELGVNILDAGHFKSENPVIPPLYEKLSAAFPDVAFFVSECCDDGVNYL